LNRIENKREERKMKRHRKYLALNLLVLSVVGLGLIGWMAISPLALAQTREKDKWPGNLIIEGMSVGSSAYAVASAFGKAIKDELGITTQVTAGVPVPVETEKVGRGESQIGYAIGEPAYEAFLGIGKYHGKPLKDLRVLTHVIDIPVHFITWPGTGIDSAANLKGKTIMGNEGGTQYLMNFTKAVLAVNGLTTENVKVITYREYGEQISFIRMKLGDAIFMSSGIRTAPLAELDRTMELKFLPFTEQEIKAVVEKYSYWLPFTIPAGSYRTQPKALRTVAFSTPLVVNAKLPESLVYELCKILYDKPGRFEIVHPEWGRFDIRSATSPRLVPFHAGAVKYYKEKGVWDSGVDKWQKEMLQKAGLAK
jgi:TRAP transporter TAXI family solute receptor